MKRTLRIIEIAFCLILSIICLLLYLKFSGFLESPTTMEFMNPEFVKSRAQLLLGVSVVTFMLFVALLVTFLRGRPSNQSPESDA